MAKKAAEKQEVQQENVEEQTLVTDSETMVAPSEESKPAEEKKESEPADPEPEKPKEPAPAKPEVKAEEKPSPEKQPEPEVKTDAEPAVSEEVADEEAEAEIEYVDLSGCRRLQRLVAAAKQLTADRLIVLASAVKELSKTVTPPAESRHFKFEANEVDIVTMNARSLANEMYQFARKYPTDDFYFRLNLVSGILQSRSIRLE